MSQAETLKAPLGITLDDVQKIKKRPVKYREADMSCVKAIAQAAINVELFTIPLYMTALYSIQGTHQITSKDSDLYEGRWWPGMGPTAGKVGSKDTKINPDSGLSTNAKVFNKVYSVFIEEMLHLQLASNMASKIGVTPSFTSNALQTEEYGWKCYDNQTSIPHIIDFKDCRDNFDGLNKKLKSYFKKHYPGKSLRDMIVKLDAMNPIQALLFLIIEETEWDAHKIIEPKYWLPTLTPEVDPHMGKRPKYFEKAPYNWWNASYTEDDLPLFGSIGHMYQSYWCYLEIEYDDGTSLLEYLVKPDLSGQRDQFNNVKDHKQYPGIAGEIGVKVDINDLKLKLINNINAITDQGEGDRVVENITSLFKKEGWVKEFLKSLKGRNNVDVEFQPSEKSLIELYPGYNDKGKPDGISGNAYARISNKEEDHFEIFAECIDLITKYDNTKEDAKHRYITWDVWHKENPDNPWTKEMLNPKNTPKNYPALPSAEDIANALNKLGSVSEKEATHITFSQSAVGTLKGLTTVLNKYWDGETNEFPNPAMGGSGDRISICWAATGIVPNLVTGIKPPETGKLYNACQGMDYADPKKAESDLMPDVTTYHSCKGSNSCQAQGGCGFVQSDQGGGSCSTMVAKSAQNEVSAGCCSHAKQSQTATVKAGCGAPDVKSAPSDNKCGGFGGCAVPISASQLFPEQDEMSPMMKLYKFVKTDDGYSAKSINTMLQFEKGESVYETAWKAYCFATDQSDELHNIKEEKVGDELIVVSADVSDKLRDPKNIDQIRLALPPST